jgi:preprotein translocase SecF subunit
MGGIKTNVEFQGGVEVEYKLPNASLTSGQINSTLLTNGVKGANVKLIASEGRVLVTIPKSELDKVKTDGKLDQDKAAKVAGFTDKNDIASFYEVGEVVQKEMVWGAINGIIISSILIVIYLAVRFGVAVGGFVTGLRFSIAAIVALLHDILVVIGLAAVVGYLLGWEISALFITAMLTMIGFSTHDTIVIFDRIRENLRRPHPGEEFSNLVNRSISQSFARSLNTSGTVIVTLIILIWVGSATPDLKFFNAAMLIGILSGTYSSIYNASPILFLVDRAIVKWFGPNSSLMAISAREMAHIKTISTTIAPTEEAAKKPEEEKKASAYGTVKRRRASAVDRSKHNVDDV